MSWALFWQVVIYVAVSSFALLSLWVIVAGFADIQQMFRDLRKQRDSNAGDDLP